MVTEITSGPIDCACVIHGDGYSWDYVDRLYSMLSRHLSRPVNLHVYTEKERVVPTPYIKHTLENWGISGPRRSWWYKLELFNPNQFNGPLLYFDLDTVITAPINWITNLSLDYFWSIRDFKHLWNSSSRTINSSVMWFDTVKFEHIYSEFKNLDFNTILQTYRGDQDFITAKVNPAISRFFDQNRVKSWRWECLDGGYDFIKRKHNTPNTGTKLTDLTSILVFHGHPKPSETTDPVVLQHWQ